MLDTIIGDIETVEDDLLVAETDDGMKTFSSH